MVENVFSLASVTATTAAAVAAVATALVLAFYALFLIFYCTMSTVECAYANRDGVNKFVGNTKDRKDNRVFQKKRRRREREKLAQHQRCIGTHRWLFFACKFPIFLLL